MVQLDGHVFTDYRETFAETALFVWRPEGYPLNAIRLTGDKFVVCRLVKTLTIYFDDTEPDACRHDWGNSGNWSVVVKLCEKFHHRCRCGYYYEFDSRRWSQIIEEIADHTMAGGMKLL